MGLSETIYASGKIVSLILVPVLRELAAILQRIARLVGTEAVHSGEYLL